MKKAKHSFIHKSLSSNQPVLGSYEESLSWPGRARTYDPLNERHAPEPLGQRSPLTIGKKMENCSSLNFICISLKLNKMCEPFIKKLIIILKGYLILKLLSHVFFRVLSTWICIISRYLITAKNLKIAIFMKLAMKLLYFRNELIIRSLFMNVRGMADLLPI